MFDEIGVEVAIVFEISSVGEMGDGDETGNCTCVSPLDWGVGELAVKVGLERMTIGVFLVWGGRVGEASGKTGDVVAEGAAVGTVCIITQA